MFVDIVIHYGNHLVFLNFVNFRNLGKSLIDSKKIFPGFRYLNKCSRCVCVCLFVFFQSAVKRRDTLQLEYETLCEDRDKKKALHDEVRLDLNQLLCSAFQHVPP